MNKDTLEKMANLAFDHQQTARSELFTAAEMAIEAKLALEAAKTAAQIGGVFDGKNAEIREAQAREHLQAEYLKLEKAEKVERACRFAFDRASIEVETVKTLLQIAELP